MAAWACGDACAKGRADEQAVYALRTLSNAAPRGFAAREASDVAWALAAARERLLPPAATDNATVADVAAFLDRLADHARSVSYAPRDVATALWACAKIAEADWRAQAASLRAVAALRANADRIKGPWPPRDAAQAAAAVASAAVDAPEVLDRATAAAARGCDRWSLRDVADVLWACARLDRPPAADAVAALCGARAVRRASAELRPNTRGRAELCSVAWAAACLAHESERHLDAAVDTVAAAHGALAADADDDGARDAGSPTLGDAPTPPGAPMARTRRLRALHHARLALAAAGASEEQLQTVDAATTNELRRAARAAWTRRPSAPSSRHEAVSKVLRGMKAQHGVVACVEIKIYGAFVRPPRHRRDALVDFHPGGGHRARRARRPRRRRARKIARRPRGRRRGRRAVALLRGRPEAAAGAHAAEAAAARARGPRGRVGALLRVGPHPALVLDGARALPAAEAGHHDAARLRRRGLVVVFAARGRARREPFGITLLVVYYA